jgi:hypothetical protein
MFWLQPWNQTDSVAQCEEQWGVTPRTTWLGLYNQNTADPYVARKRLVSTLVPIQSNCCETRLCTPKHPNMTRFPRDLLDCAMRIRNTNNGFNSFFSNSACTATSWADTVFGGRRLEVASNIVWSNGDLDPWARLGVTTSLSPSLKAVVIPVWGGEGGLL